MNEFSLINKLIKPIASKFQESQLLQDDVAKVNIDSYKNSQEIVITKDILVENVHFFLSDGAKNIAKKIMKMRKEILECPLKMPLPTHVPALS